MKRSSSTPIFIAITAFALGGMAILNKVQYDSRPRTSAEMSEEAQKEQEKQQAEMEKQQREAALRAPAGEDLASLGAEATFGNEKSAKHKVTIGYEWTPELQADPSTLTMLVQDLKKSSDVYLRVVNIDQNLDQEPGLFVDGKPLLTNVSDKPLTTDVIGQLKMILSQPTLSGSK
jgi:hypothetical protein